MALVEAAPFAREGVPGVKRGAWTGIALLAAGSTSAAAQAEDEARPVVALSYVTDILSNVDGGEKRGTAWLGRADLTVEVPGDVLGLGGVDLFADLMFLHGNDLSGRLVGDGQVVSNIDAPSDLRPIEIWANVDLSGGRRIKMGMIDLNSEFDVQQVGTLFLNSSHGIGPDFSQSGHNGPSIFPSTSLGLVAEQATERYELRAGIFDALPGTLGDPRRLVVRAPIKHGALLAAEGQINLSQDTLLRVGGWHYTKGFDRLDPSEPRRGHSSGVYAMAEGRLFEAKSRSGDAWVRVGTARSEVNPIATSVGAGFSYGDDNQKVGVAVAYARLGDPALARFRAEGVDPERAETAIELTYAKRISSNLQLQPNLQYIVNPGWDRDRSDALVMGLRLAFDFTLR